MKQDFSLDKLHLIDHKHNDCSNYTIILRLHNISARPDEWVNDCK